MNRLPRAWVNQKFTGLPEGAPRNIRSRAGISPGFVTKKMLVKIKPPSGNPENMLDWIPERAIEWQLDGENKVFLVKEKSGRRWMKWMIHRVGKSQNFHIHLDEFGTHAWQQADGVRDLAAIAIEMKSRFGSDFPDGEKRTCAFFATLAKHGFIHFKKTA